MKDKHLLILDFVSEGRLSVDEAVVLIEAISEAPAREVWLIPYPHDWVEDICLN
jgi:hypothetical protein